MDIVADIIKKYENEILNTKYEKHRSEDSSLRLLTIDRGKYG